MKRKAKELSKKDYIHTLDLLYTSASSVQGRNAMKSFLRDLLTESERVMLGRRIWIARLLLSGEKHTQISERLKVSMATIWRVEKWLSDKMPGYEKAIQGLEKEMNKRAIQCEIKNNPFGYAALKKKYPLHFLLFPEPKLKKNKS